MCHCHKAARMEREMESILVAAIPHPAGEKAHRRRQLVQESILKKQSLLGQMHHSVKALGPDEGGPGAAPEGDQAVEQNWRDMVNEMLAECEAKAADPTLPDDEV